MFIEKVVINIGVGQAGEKVEKALRVLADLTGRKPVPTRAKKTVRDFGIRRGENIGAKVTLRGPEAERLLRRLLEAKGNRIPASCFDENGNFSFGIKEHIEIPGMKYDPEIGIFGMDVCVSLARPGYRVARRRRARSHVGKAHRIGKEEAIAYVKGALGVEVI
jgi:large subunit ribosomal protein L5